MLSIIGALQDPCTGYVILQETLIDRFFEEIGSAFNRANFDDDFFLDFKDFLLTKYGVALEIILDKKQNTVDGGFIRSPKTILIYLPADIEKQKVISAENVNYVVFHEFSHLIVDERIQKQLQYWR